MLPALVWAACAVVASGPAVSDEPTGLSAGNGAAMGAAEGLYVGAGVGTALGTGVDLDGAGVNADASTDPGVAAGIAFGYRTASGFRPELEASYRRADIDDISGAAGGRGTVSAWSMMANVNYDIDLGSDIRPYVGVGAGLGVVDLDGASPVGATRIDDSAVAPLIQGIAGIGYRFTDAVEGYADYRYVRSLDAEFRSDAGTDIDGVLDSHTVTVGLRWFFDRPGRISKAPAMQPALAESASQEPAAAAAPAEAPPPEPAPEPVAEPAPRALPRFLVFFGFDKSDLMPEALEVVRLAAQAATEGQAIRIDATGHADRAGPETYNQGLSERRAESVRKALIDLGVPAQRISIKGEGETMPLVKTADGVREPQNRRVEILLSGS